MIIKHSYELSERDFVRDQYFIQGLNDILTHFSFEHKNFLNSKIIISPRRGLAFDCEMSNLKDVNNYVWTT